MYSVPNDKKTTWYYRVIRWLVWVFSPKYRLEGTENLPQEPCVIVGNHSHMYGPIAGELYIPGKHYVWCAGEMMNWKEVHAYAYRDFWFGKPKAVSQTRACISISSGLVPSIQQLTTEPPAFSGLPDSRNSEGFKPSVRPFSSISKTPISDRYSLTKLPVSVRPQASCSVCSSCTASCGKP